MRFAATFCVNRRLSVALAVALSVGICSVSLAAQPQHRGIWMHASYIKTPAQADRCVELIDRAHLNAVYLLVWYWGGQAAFQSQFCPMLDGVQAGYDPTGYMIEKCHRQGIEVHAWFVNGSYGSPTPLHVLDRHPDWLVEGEEAGGRLWYDFGKPAVRKFQSDLMIEALTRYDLDGIHFDYIRYDGSAICYCKHCQAEFAAQYGCGTIEKSTRNVYPFTARLAGNPVAGPTTARVLAQFSDGTPAIAVNDLDKGNVLLLNWHALRRILPPVAETWNRALRQWNATADRVFLMNTAANRQRYGTKSVGQAEAALHELGCEVKTIGEEDLDTLPPGSLVVLNDVYVIPDNVAQSLEHFVREGGRLVVVDGPVHAIRNASIQRLLGMNRTAAYINGRMEFVQPVGSSELVPSDGTKVDLKPEIAKLEKWADYRKAGVTALVRDVYARAKQVKPRVQVTAAVFTPVKSAEQAYQDWPGWLREGIIDYVIPMAYTAENASLAKQLDDWKTVDPRLERIVPGLCLSVKTGTEALYANRDVELILTQYRMCQEAGARGVAFYALDNTDDHPMLMLTDPLIAALREGPFADKVPTEHPPAHGASR
ncbi:MAG: family 10 glycosylhydrolase [Planctomycetaceae bacterium]|nr:family 10 glycosylhydrolase [Planctomycetaceae bacterium]